MKVRCTNCMKEFDENKIIFDGDTDMEFCPERGESGCLMDLDDTETEKSNDLSVENPIDKIVILANDAMLNALQQSDNAQAKLVDDGYVSISTFKKILDDDYGITIK